MCHFAFFTFFSENLKNLTVRSGRQRGVLPDHKEERQEEKMDISEGEKNNTHPTSQSKYIKQAKNATSKANAEKMALNAIREKIELEKMKVDAIIDKEEQETHRKERSRTPAKSASLRRSQKSASNYNSTVADNSSYSEDKSEPRQGKSYIDISNRHTHTQYSTTFPDFRSRDLVEGNKEVKMEMEHDSDQFGDNEAEIDNTHSESKYIKRKHSSKTVTDNKQKLKSKSPEPIVLTPREPPSNARTNTFTVNMEAPYNQEQENSHKASDSPPERKKVSIGIFCLKFEEFNVFFR